MALRQQSSSRSADRGRLLARALRANAFFSGASGALALLAAPAVAEALGAVPQALVRLLGSGLVAFALAVAALARAPRPAWVRAVVAADLAWVAGSLVAVAFGGAWLSPEGARLVLALAAVVAALAALQTVGLQRAFSAAAPSAARRAVVLQVAAPPAAVWRVVGERWGDVHELLPRLSASRLLDEGPPCVGATRVCTLTAPVMGMREVRERLVAWRPPVGFAYEVLDPPFPLARLRNAWRIEAEGDGTRLTLAPEVELRGGAATRWMRGALLGSLMRELDKDVAQMRAAIERAALADEAHRVAQA